ncbi:GON-4-like protein [Centroberyx gerrardi]
MVCVPRRDRQEETVCVPRRDRQEETVCVPRRDRQEETVCVPRRDRQEKTVCVPRRDRQEKTVCVPRRDRQEETVCVPRRDRQAETVHDDGLSIGEEVFPRRPWEELSIMETGESSDDELGQLDIDLDRKSKQHNLTSNNVRAILHEVITHEHVVAMMKAAIQETQDLPMFEPKMTRSRLKQVVQEESPVNAAMAKPPQFVDILLEEEEDSSDEEYCPDEEEEDETFLSDVDSVGSSPRMPLGSRSRQLADQRTDSPAQRARCPRHLRVEPAPLVSSCAPQHLLPAPTDSSFLERLHAVEEELASNPACHSYQPLNTDGDDDEDDDDASGLAYRTRSKRPLVDVPLGQLEAELLAPDITADMYDESGALLEEDRHWSQWLQGLMASDSEEDGDDEDDPEYNFLDDLDEPDLEDYRTDRAVRITKKEVNELLEELFDTLQEELEVGAQEEEAPLQTVPKFNVPQALRFEAPLASMLTERRRAVRQQYEALQQRRALQDTPSHHHDNPTPQDTPGQRPNAPASTLLVPGRICPALYLDHGQKLQLQQQIEQHVQLLTQVHLLSRRVDALNHEACITKQYLEELQQFSSHQEEMFLTSSFRSCNLQEAMDLLQEVEEREETPPPRSPPAARRWLPRMSAATSSHAYPLLPADTAWLFATRSVFLYPELLPVCSLDPGLHPPHPRTMYTSGEDCLIVLGLKHFEETVLPDQLLSSYLVCKRHQYLRQHVSQMCGPKAPQDNVIKLFCQKRVVPPMPVSCSRVSSAERLPPVDRDTSATPNWLKKSQQMIQKTRLASSRLPSYPPSCPPSYPPSYPPSLPANCTLRLHPSLPSLPSLPSKTTRQTTQKPKRFNLAHTASLPPLAKAPADSRPIGCLAHVPGPAPSQAVTLIAKTPNDPVQRTLPLARPPAHGTMHPVSPPPVCGNARPSSTRTAAPPVGQRNQRQPDKPCRHSLISSALLPAPPLSSKSHPDQRVAPGVMMPMKPDYILVQMMWTPRTCQVQRDAEHPDVNSQHALGVGQSSEEQLHRQEEEEESSSGSSSPSLHSQAGKVERKMEGGEAERREERRIVGKEEQMMKREEGEELMEELESLASTSTLSPLSSPGRSREEEVQEEEEERNWTVQGIVTCNGGENSGGEEQEGGDGGSGGGGEEEPSGEREGEHEGEERGEGEEDGERESGGERDDDGEKDGDGEQDRQGEEEEEEDFDDLTQDEDEEEVMSSASEESVLSVPELQETMKQLTWLASEGRLCGDADSEEDHSPGSQEENSEEEEEGPAKGEESGEGRSAKVTGDEETPSGEGTPRSGGRGPGRGRGRARPPRGLRRSRQERHSKDSTKLLLLYDDNILDNDPHRESKDVAFAQSYLGRVREALQDVPGKVEEFLALLYEFEQVGEGRDVVALFRRLRCILGDRTDLLRDFAAFLHPEQALECGLFEEQQAFERSRRFLRQLEISFGENPSHYQKIIKALQGGPDLSPASIHELKAQMASLLKGHTHLQGEFWVFFDELRPAPARPGQFEEAHWPDEGGGSDGGEAIGSGSGGGASSGFEEVTLPELEEEEEGHKIQPMVSRRRRRKIGSHGNYKECDWSDKDWPCLCRDAKIRRHRRKGCPRCHGNKTSEGVSRAMKSLDPLYSQIGSAHDEQGDKDLDSELKEEDDSGANSPQPGQSVASWEGSFPLADEKEEEDDEMEDEEDDEDEEERKNDREQSPELKRSREDEERLGSLQHPTSSTCTSSTCTSSSVSTLSSCTSSTCTSSSISTFSTYICTPSSVSTLPSRTSTSSTSSSISTFSTSICTPSSISSSTSTCTSSSVSSLSTCTSSTCTPSSVSSSISTFSSSICTPSSISSSTSICTSSSVFTLSTCTSSSITPSSTSSSIAPSSSITPSSTTTSSSITPSSTSSSITPSSSTSSSITSSSITPSSSTSSSITPSSSTPSSSTSSSITPSSSTSSSITPSSSTSSSITPSSSITSSSSSAPLQLRPSPPPDLPVCAKNISLTASGEKVILWTREADRVILTACQQEGANQNTFQAVSTLLGNKTPNEVSRRFRDLMRLFRTAARQTSSEDEAPPNEPPAANEEPE